MYIPDHAELKISDVPLCFVTEAKILGIWIQNNLKWDKNVNEITKRANQKLFMLKLLKKFGFSDEELVTVYKGYVRPLLEYADVAWHSSITDHQSHVLEQLQRRACRIILGHRYSTYVEAAKACDLESLADRREDHCRTFAKGLSKSERTKDLLPPSRLEVHGRNLRSAHKLSQLRCRTSRFQNSPIPHYISLLNK